MYLLDFPFFRAPLRGYAFPRRRRQRRCSRRRGRAPSAASTQHGPMPHSSRDLRFEGRISGWGTSSGTRVVVGSWYRSPLGSFADVMVERPDGEPVLLAPTAEVAEFVGSTYRFDTTVLTTVSVETANGDRKSTRLNSSHVAISYAVF